MLQVLRSASLATSAARRSMGTVSEVLRHAANGGLARDTEIIEGNLKEGQVMVELLAATVTSADVGAKAGSVGGAGGSVGRVAAVGKGVWDFSVGDRVVSLSSTGGNWRTQFVVDTDSIMAVPASVSNEQAVLVPTACAAIQLMARHGKGLAKDDYLIQNEAETVLGQMIIQLAHAKGVHTINVLRTELTERAHVTEYLQNMGGDIVLPDFILQSKWRYQRLTEGVPTPKLAINSIVEGSAQAKAFKAAKGFTARKELVEDGLTDSAKRVKALQDAAGGEKGGVWVEVGAGQQFDPNGWAKEADANVLVSEALSLFEQGTLCVDEDAIVLTPFEGFEAYTNGQQGPVECATAEWTSPERTVVLTM